MNVNLHTTDTSRPVYKCVCPKLKAEHMSLKAEEIKEITTVCLASSRTFSSVLYMGHKLSTTQQLGAVGFCGMVVRFFFLEGFWGGTCPEIKQMKCSK